MINKQVVDRSKRIIKIIGLIKNNPGIDLKELKMQLCSEENISARLAAECIKEALWRISNGEI